MTEALLEAVLRRDRITVAVALAALTALAWSYVLWLAHDMDMGGMDMTGFRMAVAAAGMAARCCANISPGKCAAARPPAIAGIVLLRNARREDPDCLPVIVVPSAKLKPRRTRPGRDFCR